jgi:hypothetical protein
MCLVFNILLGKTPSKVKISLPVSLNLLLWLWLRGYLKFLWSTMIFCLEICSSII